MKRFFTGASLLVLTVILFGCEGHVKTLYLKENKSVSAPWSLSAKTIIIKSNKDVYAEVDKIAKSLSLQKNTLTKNTYYLGNFFMHVDKKGKGLWEIGLKDWPETSQSEISKKVEKAIEERLEENDNPISANPDSSPTVSNSKQKSIVVLTNYHNKTYQEMYKELGAPADKTGYSITNAPTKGWNHRILFSTYPKNEKNKDIHIMEVMWNLGDFSIFACYHMVNGQNRCLVAKRIRKGIRF